MTSHITVVGNCTNTPELRFTPSGAANCKFGVAVNRRWQNKQSGDWQEQTSFLDIVTWKELAENVGSTVKKGDRVIVSGRLEQRSYDDKEGNKRYVFEIIADEVGPSLRWATAQVTRNEKPAGGAGRAPSRQDDYGDEPF